MKDILKLGNKSKAIWLQLIRKVNMGNNANKVKLETDHKTTSEVKNLDLKEKIAKIQTLGQKQQHFKH